MLARAVFYAITVPTLVAELIYFHHKTGSFKQAILYTLLTAKFFVIMAMLAGLDTVAFYLVFYRKAGDAIVITNKIPVSFGWLALFMLFVSVMTIYTYNKILAMTPSNIREVLEVVEA